MRFNVISERGDGLGIATHLSSEGHTVSMLSVLDSRIGNGIIKATEDENDLSGDMMIYDSETFGKDADAVRKLGKRVLGSSHWSQMIDVDEDYAHKVIKLTGWDTDSVINGTNLYITCWFNGEGFISTYASLVYRRFMSGGRGPDINFTGVVGNFYQPTERIYNEFLKPLEPILKRVNHRGAFHIHALIDGDKYSVKGINASFHSPLSLLLFENSKTTVAEITLKLFDEGSKALIPIEQWAAGIMISVPPYPYNLEVPTIALEGLELPAMKHVWLIDAQKTPEGWMSAGVHGKLGYVTARGANVHEATKRVYRTINNLRIRDLQFRDDVGRGVERLLDSLRVGKWLK